MAAVKLLHNPVAQRIFGAVILGLALMSFLIGYNSNILDLQKQGYKLQAQFFSVEGLQVGSPVTLSGIEVSEIDSIALQESNGNYKVMVSFYLDDSIILSDDSSATITSNNIFGGKHLRLTQGGSFLELQDGDEILYTTSSVDFLQLLDSLVSRAESR